MNRAQKYAQLLCPYPTIAEDGSLRSGTVYGQCQICADCRSRDCSKLVALPGTEVTHHTCPYGLSVFVARFEDETVTINGMHEPSLNSAISQRTRRRVRRHRIRIDQISEWRAVALRMLAEISLDIDGGVKESVGSLHDIATAVNLIYRNAEALVDEYGGAGFDERLENAPPSLKSLYKAVSLLSTTMAAASAAANPESVSYGQRRPWAIYKLFDKMCHLFEESADLKHVRVRVTGSSMRRPMAHDSIETLALVLLDNAVKYAVKGTEIVVRVNDVIQHATAVWVEVDSVGYVVDPDERECIFEKGYRSRGAKQVAAAGAGLGLYIARLIAESHGFEIAYRVAEIDERIGHNIFSFRIE